MKWIDGDELLFKLEQYRKFVEQIEDNYLALMVFSAVERDINKLKEDGITTTSTDGQAEVRLAPIIHGHWIGKPIAGYSTVRCSVCRSVFSENNGKWNYCPDCGAKMDEVNE